MSAMTMAGPHVEKDIGALQDAEACGGRQLEVAQDHGLGFQPADDEPENTLVLVGALHGGADVASEWDANSAA